MVELAHKRTASHDRGFALIELLIAVAIMAILMSIIIVAVTEARNKARITKKNEIARQYINAFNFYFDDHGTYPDRPGVFCLGYKTGENCAPSVQGNSGLYSDLQPYYASMPKESDLVVMGFSGFIYIQIPNDPKEIRWLLPGANQPCLSGALPWSDPDKTVCHYYFYE